MIITRRVSFQTNMVDIRMTFAYDLYESTWFSIPHYRSSIARNTRGTHESYSEAKLVYWPLRNRTKVLVNVILDMAFFV